MVSPFSISFLSKFHTDGVAIVIQILESVITIGLLISTSTCFPIFSLNYLKNQAIYLSMSMMSTTERYLM